MSKSLPPRARREAGTGKAGRKPPAKTVLLVDDDKTARAKMIKALDGGYRFLEAGDGEEALSVSLAHEGPIHLLVTDVMTPVMNGKELAERLCAMRPEISVLFVSGYASEDVLSGNGCGGREWWLAKPFTPAQLVAMARRALGSAKR